MSISVFRLVTMGSALLLLGACNEATPNAVNEAVPAPETTSPPHYVGTWAFDPAWCTDQSQGFPITIAETRFEGRENVCDMTDIAPTPEGGWTANLSCISEGTTTEERLAMTPVGEQLALTWPDRPESETTLFTRCP